MEIKVSHIEDIKLEKYIEGKEHKKEDTGNFINAILI